MSAVDLFGHAPVADPFSDIRNQQAKVAAEKAELCASLNTLLRRTPHPSCIGSVQQVRRFQAAHKKALRICKSSSSSRQQLRDAINQMGGWFDEKASANKEPA